ncbi:MAG: hypothetical protein ABMB14_10865 [Myxococcota bacterium]
MRLVDKHAVPWMSWLGFAVRPMMPAFMDAVTTVIGDTVYLPGPPASLDRTELARILAHELVHQLDQADHGGWFYASYAAVPAPVGRTMRAYWERRAYAVDLLLAWHDGGEPALARAADHVARLFSGPAYGFMWAGSDAARAYLAPVVDDVRSGALARRAPYREILAAWTGEETW